MIHFRSIYVEAKMCIMSGYSRRTSLQVDFAAEQILAFKEVDEPDEAQLPPIFVSCIRSAYSSYRLCFEKSWSFCE